jgi:hypothetical protein
MNWIRKKPVEHFDFFGERESAGVLARICAYCQSLFTLCDSGYRVHCVTNQLYLEWKLFTDSHILIYFCGIASDSS